MKTSLFDFHLPESLIATHPVSPRDGARMLVVGERLQDSVIRNLPQFLKSGDVMVFNDTKVIPARLFGKRGEARVEVLLHRQAPHLLRGLLPDPATSAGLVWQCFARPAKRLKVGDRIDFAADFSATVVKKLPSGEVLLSFSPSPPVGEGGERGISPHNQTSNALRVPPLPNPPPQGGREFENNFYHLLERHGHMPLPPYIAREDTASDQAHYQTVYAKHKGSVAAPTAGLHFTDALLAAIDAMGVVRTHVTLHVGGGTFLPVKVEDTADHIMHSEFATITADTANAINTAKSKGGRVIAVGTTSLRTLESAADAQGHLQSFSGETAIFITPGYRFKIVDRLLTNFHLPRSTLFMLVSAFSGLKRMQAAYAHAMAQYYRFYSYGDACLLTRNDEASNASVSS